MDNLPPGYKEKDEETEKNYMEDGTAVEMCKKCREELNICNC